MTGFIIAPEGFKVTFSLMRGIAMRISVRELNVGGDPLSALQKTCNAS